jgi:hypothetical protein
MGWVPDSMWLSYVNVSTPAGELRHDLAVSTNADTLPSARLAGFVTHGDRGAGVPWGWFVLMAGVPLVVIGGGRVLARRRVS